MYNPKPGWEHQVMDGLEKLQEALPHHRISLGLVDDGSDQKVLPEAIAYCQKKWSDFSIHSYAKNQGKGFAIRYAVKEGPEADITVYTDYDLPYSHQSMVDLVETLERSDVAFGIRDEDYYAQVPSTRTKISKGLKWLNRQLTGLPFDDTQAGLKGFNAKGKTLFLKTKIKRFLFDLEFVAAAFHHHEIQLKTVKVSLRKDIEFSRFSPKTLLIELSSYFRLLLTINGRRFARNFSRKKSNK